MGENRFEHKGPFQLAEMGSGIARVKAGKAQPKLTMAAAALENVARDAAKLAKAVRNGKTPDKDLWYDIDDIEGSMRQAKRELKKAENQLL